MLEGRSTPGSGPFAGGPGGPSGPAEDVGAGADVSKAAAVAVVVVEVDVVDSAEVVDVVDEESTAAWAVRGGRRGAGPRGSDMEDEVAAAVVVSAAGGGGTPTDGSLGTGGKPAISLGWAELEGILPKLEKAVPDEARRDVNIVRLRKKHIRATHLQQEGVGLGPLQSRQSRRPQRLGWMIDQA